MNLTYRIECVSPLFSYGANQNTPEIRAASIRGQLHQWFRLQGGTYEEERAIFGGIANKSPKLADHASKLIVRVADINVPGKIRSYPRLPHKQGGKAAATLAFPPGTRFTVHLQDRYGGLGELERSLVQTVEAWLLLGALGTRATRGGGSLQCIDDGWPDSVEAWKRRLQKNVSSKCGFKVLMWPGEAFEDEESARKVITDTIGGPADTHQDGSSLAQIRFPLGVVGNKHKLHVPRRKTSPLKLRVYRFTDGYRIVGIRDTRQEVTGNTERDFTKVRELLKHAGKKIHQILPSESKRS